VQSLVAFAGGLFILLLFVQFMDGFQPKPDGANFALAIFVIIAMGILCAGTAFPGLRTKEKAQGYLLLPASTFEKFLMEFLTRIILFMLIVPAVYWVVGNLEGNLVRLFQPSFYFNPQVPFVSFGMHVGPPGFMGWVYSLAISMYALVLTIPFTGATIFTKNPLIKTLFGVAIIFFFNLLVIYFFLSVLDFRRYYPSGRILFMADGDDSIIAGAIICTVMCMGFICAAYFKLKEKEV
jgi:hypothetical protein